MIDIWITSWPSVEERAYKTYQDIKQIVPDDCNLNVLFQSNGRSCFDDIGNCWNISSHLYHGPQSEFILSRSRFEVTLKIDGDVTSENWAFLIHRCKTAFRESPYCMVWAPSVDYSAWSGNDVVLARLTEGLELVTQTDCMIWALRDRVKKRLIRSDLHDNNLGWGIDWLASCFAYTNGGIVVRDTKVLAQHPKARGYNSSEANAQQIKYLQGMTDDEKLMYRFFQLHRSLVR